MINEPEQNEQLEEAKEETKPLGDSIMDSIKFVVDMMNQGKANPKDVYPPNRYHGD